MSKIKTLYAYVLAVCIVFVFTAYPGVSQSFLNLDFEYGVEKDQPRKWSIEGEGTDYFARLDSIVAISGTHSLYITQKEAEVYIFLRIPGSDIAGKTIKVEGYIRFDKENSLQGKLLFNEPGSSVSFPSKSADTKQNGWQVITNEVSFPQDFLSDRLLIALTTSGTGKYWLDHISITINGKPYGNAPPDFREPTKKEIEILNEKAVPTELLHNKTKDLSRLKNIIGNTSIVALGENSHGSSSIYKLKLELVKTLVQKFGFTVFALEMPVAEAENLDRYVHYGKGTKEEVIKNLAYKSWQTQDMLNIVEWIRLYNTTTERKISFQGFDIQDNGLALKRVEDFAKKHDGKLLKKLIDLRSLIGQVINKSRNWQTVYQKADSIYKYLESKNISNYPSANNDTLLKIKHNMGVYLQSLTMNYKTDSTKSRDEYMAENIDWIVKNAPPGSKIIVSADNTHTSKASGKMGNYLKKVYGAKYLVWGFTYNNGTYTAYGEKKHYDVHPSYTGTAEYLFSKSRHKKFFLDLREMDDLTILSQPIGFRSIGSKPQETGQFAEIILRDHFDVIVFISTSLHTDYLKE